SASRPGAAKLSLNESDRVRGTMKALPVLWPLLCVCALHSAGIYLFLSGFLLVRLEVNRTSTCGDVLQPSGEEHGDFCRAQPRFRRAVLLIIDALKMDFARFDPNNTAPRPYENKLPVLEETLSGRPSHSRLYPFRADPPTTTMQRIKGFTTGSLPTFVDVGNNFASSAILEDNLIHQFGQVGKRVVFMGDDTWESLFPRSFHRSLPFPSFNVKDLHTVDEGILRHLYPTMAGGDWEVLVAHFLGVDHCGHRFGPDHPAMADKLTQMDGVIRSVMERLQNDTLLVVMGDHGMTDSGDHGGESQKETDAAIFLYSPSPLFPAPPSQGEPAVVPQTDLVPTLALLLGVPIPYSSVGQVLLPLFPSGQTEGLSQLDALWINAKQVNRFLETYASMATDIPAHSLSELKEEFSRLSADYLAAVGGAPSSSPRLAAAMQAYLTRVRDTCRATWARFSPAKMAAGLLILGLACVLCLAVSEKSGVLLRGEGPGLKRPAAAALMAAGCVAAAQLLLRGHVEAAWCLAAAALDFELSFLWRCYRCGGVATTTKSACKPSRGGGWLRLPAPPAVVLLLRCCSLLSDSYVIAEGRAVTFLLFSLALYLPVRLNWEGLLLPAGPEPLKAAGLLPSNAMPPPPSAVRRESGTFLGCWGLLTGCLFLSLSFHACREEQGACRPSPFLSPLSRLQDHQLRNLHYALAVLSLGSWTYLLRRWLRHYGNLNSSGGAVFVARWLLPSACACLALHWAVGATPEDSFRNLSELMRLAQLALPRTAFALLGLALLLIWVDPLTVFVKTRVAGSGAAPPPPRYRASTGVSPQAELHHLIPQLYQRMRRSLDEGEPAGSGAAGGRATVEAYGLGTVYSAPLLLLCGVLGVGLLLLHPEGMALSFLLLLLEAGALLHLHASSVSLGGLQRASTGGFDVPWTPVISWSLAAAQFFHATGHLPTFTSIQWSSAFVGFPDGHAGTALPAALVTLNTFASHILFGAACPLLLLWPLLREAGGSAGGGRACGDEGQDAVMEMRLRENPQFSSALLQLSARYLFVQGVQQVFSSVCAAAVLRRHLMVWKVFAPKLMFEASSFLVSSAALLLGLTLVLRVDVAVGRWFRRLLPDASR
uniref:GPI ethanolamine phosphate transferase 3, catalytic subunit n=1 Tax=Tetraodon nigroviridis TaxID=99883 RepID=H3CAA8_TETNG